jgi:hypothetical protein
MVRSIPDLQMLGNCERIANPIVLLLTRAHPIKSGQLTKSGVHSSVAPRLNP